jgi:hypothetical protein
VGGNSADDVSRVDMNQISDTLVLVSIYLVKYLWRVPLLTGKPKGNIAAAAQPYDFDLNDYGEWDF